MTRNAPTPEAIVTERKDIVERLREEARQEESAHKMLADAKTARQTDREDAWTDAGYDWVRAEQTTRWLAADEIERLQAENAALREALTAISDESVFNQQRFAEDTDTDYFLRCFKAVKERARAALDNPSPEPFAVIAIYVDRPQEGGGCEGRVVSLHMTREEAERVIASGSASERLQ